MLQQDRFSRFLWITQSRDNLQGLQNINTPEHITRPTKSRMMISALGVYILLRLHYRPDLVYIWVGLFINDILIY